MLLIKKKYNKFYKEGFLFFHLSSTISFLNNIPDEAKCIQIDLSWRTEYENGKLVSILVDFLCILIIFAYLSCGPYIN